MTRREKLLAGLDLKRMRGIEIGPLTSPIVRKDESEIYYIDHASREELQTKYAQDPNVDIQKIVPIDSVWGDRTLRECCPDSSYFDYVIASHVLEHVPDMLGWMREVAEVLRPGGRLILAIPDKRFTFDYLRQPTRVSEVVDAYLRRNRRPMPSQIFDYNANAVEVDMIAAWDGRIDPASLKHYVNLRFALDRSIESIQYGKYIDGHCWVFTSRSLAAVLADLVDLDLLCYSCLNLYEPERNTNEIVLTLERWHNDASTNKEQGRHSFTTHIDRLDEIERNRLEQDRRRVQHEKETASRMRQNIAMENAQLKNQVYALEADIKALLFSRSFRVTRPFRKLRASLSSLLFHVKQLKNR